jgi:hypothetical protein
MPEVIDKPIQLLGQAFGPVALVMVGITLALTPIGRHWRGALVQALVKNLLHPLLVAGIGWLLGVRGIPLTVMVVAAALPIGANVFLFSQRYRTAEDLVTASVAVSTVLALGTLTLVMVWVQWLPESFGFPFAADRRSFALSAVREPLCRLAGVAVWWDGARRLPPYICRLMIYPACSSPLVAMAVVATVIALPRPTRAGGDRWQAVPHAVPFGRRAARGARKAGGGRSEARHRARPNAKPRPQATASAAPATASVRSAERARWRKGPRPPGAAPTSTCAPPSASRCRTKT